MPPTKGRFCNTIAAIALVHTSIQSDWRMQTKEILSTSNSNKHSHKVTPKPVRQTLTWCWLREVFKSSYGFRLRDSEAEQRALQSLHIYCSNVNSYCSAPESNKQNPPDTTIDLPFFFRFISTYILLQTSLRPHQARVIRAIYSFYLFTYLLFI